VYGANRRVTGVRCEEVCCSRGSASSTTRASSANTYAASRRRRVPGDRGLERRHGCACAPPSSACSTSFRRRPPSATAASTSWPRTTWGGALYAAAFELPSRGQRAEHGAHRLREPGRGGLLRRLRAGPGRLRRLPARRCRPRPLRQGPHRPRRRAVVPQRALPPPVGRPRRPPPPFGTRAAAAPDPGSGRTRELVSGSHWPATAIDELRTVPVPCPRSAERSQTCRQEAVQRTHWKTVEQVTVPVSGFESHALRPTDIPMT
jgi:hypothetical protein